VTDSAEANAGPAGTKKKQRKAKPSGSAFDPLPDPRLAPLTTPDPERVAARAPAPPRLAAMKAMGGVGTLGLEVALSIMVGLFGGQWLDNRFGASPWLTLAGSAFGLAAAVRAILRQMRIMKKEAAKEEAAEGNPAPVWESDGDRKRREDDQRQGEDLDSDASDKASRTKGDS